MNKHEKIKKLLPYIMVGSAIILFITAITLNLNTNYFSLGNNTNKNDHQLNNEIQEDTIGNSNSNENEINQENQHAEHNKDNQVDQDKEVITNNDDNQSNNSTTDNDQNNNSNISNSNNDNQSSSENNNQVETTKSETELINYFQATSLSLDNSNNQEDLTLREKTKNAFVSIIDFIFYDKEIKGYKFKDLTLKTKLQIIKIATSIDNKIDKYFPNYKDIIKDKYSNIKSKLVSLYMKTAVDLCDKVGEYTCNQAKSDFKDMKDSFGFTWSLIKEIVLNGSSKVKDWYQSIR